MARAKTIVNEEKVIELYKKYGTLIDVSMRTDYSKAKVKETLIKNGIEVNKHPKTEWNKVIFSNTNH